MAIAATLQKASNREDKVAAREDSAEMQVDSVPKEESYKKFEFANEQVQEDSTKLTANKDFELDITNALEKADVNSSL